MFLACESIPLIILPSEKDTLGYSWWQKDTLDYAGPLKKTPLVILDVIKITLIIPGLEKDTLYYLGTMKDTFGGHT